MALPASLYQGITVVLRNGSSCVSVTFLSMLPVKLVCKITDEDGTDTDVSNFTYTFNPDHSVDIINVTDGYGSTYNFKYVYYKK